MKKIYLLLLLFAAFMTQASAQGCATLYPDSTYTLIVVCTPGGVGSYGITIAQQGGINFTISGLDAQSQSTVTATCSGNTFSFPNTPLPAGGSIQGGGTWTGTGTVNVAYGVYDANSTLIDSCVGTFNVIVGMEDPQPGFMVELFPNPTQQNASVHVSGIEAGENWAYEVFDLRGRAVMRGEGKDAQSANLPLETMEAGLYHVVVRSGNEVQVKALLKH